MQEHYVSSSGALTLYADYYRQHAEQLKLNHEIRLSPSVPTTKTDYQGYLHQAELCATAPTQIALMQSHLHWTREDIHFELDNIDSYREISRLTIDAWTLALASELSNDLKGLLWTLKNRQRAIYGAITQIGLSDVMDWLVDAL